MFGTQFRQVDRRNAERRQEVAFLGSNGKARERFAAAVSAIQVFIRCYSGKINAHAHSITQISLTVSTSSSFSCALQYPEGSVVPVVPVQINAGKSSQATTAAVAAPTIVAQIVPSSNQNGMQPLFQAAQPVSGVAEVNADTTADANDAKDAKKPKKKKRKVKEDPMAKASGPSNAEQAHSMRNVFGFTSTPPATNGTTQAEPAQPSAALQAKSQDPITPSSPAPVQQPQVLPPMQQPVQAQQAQQPVPAQHAQHAQQQPAMQPQQQANFKFGFAADTPAEADSAPASALPAQISHSMTAPAAQAPVAEQSAAAAQPASDHVPRRVFIGGMPFSYEVDAIREYWSYCGEIEDLDVMRFPDTGRFKGIAFITFTTEEGYEEALKCDGTDLDGQQLRVQKCVSAGQHASKKKQAPAGPAAEAASPAAPQQPPAPKVAGYHVAYVGNLAFDASDTEVQQLFPDCNVTKVRLHTDKVTGKSRGFAHVHFLDEAGLDKALQCNGASLHGRSVKVSYAQPKKK